MGEVYLPGSGIEWAHDAFKPKRWPSMPDLHGLPCLVSFNENNCVPTIVSGTMAWCHQVTQGELGMLKVVIAMTLRSFFLRCSLVPLSEPEHGPGRIIGLTWDGTSRSFMISPMMTTKRSAPCHSFCPRDLLSSPLLACRTVDTRSILVFMGEFVVWGARAFLRYFWRNTFGYKQPGIAIICNGS